MVRFQNVYSVLWPKKDRKVKEESGIDLLYLFGVCYIVLFYIYIHTHIYVIDSDPQKDWKVKTDRIQNPIVSGKVPPGNLT